MKRPHWEELAARELLPEQAAAAEAEGEEEAA